MMLPISRLVSSPRLTKATVRATAAAPAAVAAPVAPQATGSAKTWLIGHIHAALLDSPRLNKALGNLTGPFIKKRFNAPDKPITGAIPAALLPSTVAEANKIMASAFRPQEGKVVVAIAGGGAETVHCFVVSGVKPNGNVEITQAIAQYIDKPEAYQGLGGKISQFLDKKLGNKPQQMKGVVVEDWQEYAARSKRNSIVVMQLDADPKEVQAALKELKALVGRPYDRTFLAGPTGTAATQQEMYCTEVSAWFVNRLKPGTIQMSEKSGIKVYQVTDHMATSSAQGGPLKVLYNGQNRLDVAKGNPFPADK